MGETKETVQDVPQITGLPSESDKGSTSTPKTYTEGTEEFNQLKSNLKAEAGRAWKKQVESLTSERDSLTTEKGNLSSELTQLKEETKDLNDLKSQIEELSKNDPDYAKLRADYQSRLKTLKEKEKVYDTRELSFADREKKVQAFERDALIAEIAEGFEGADPDKLRDAINKFKDRDGNYKLTDQQEIEDFASSLWIKKPDETVKPKVPQNPPLKTDSNISTGGGGTDFDKLTPREKIEYGLKNPKK